MLSPTLSLTFYKVNIKKSLQIWNLGSMNLHGVLEFDGCIDRWI